MFLFCLLCAAERGDGRTVCGRKTTQCLPYSRCSTIILSFDLGWIATEDRNNILLGEKEKGVMGEIGGEEDAQVDATSTR